MKMDEWSVKLGDFIYSLPNEWYLAYKGRRDGEPQCENTKDDGLNGSTQSQYHFEIELESSF